MDGTLPQRRLGSNGPLVSCLGLGCMGMSGTFGAADRDASLATLNRAIDLGCTFLDTADVYGSGHNEELLAEVLKTRRDEVFVCTKFALRMVNGLPGKPEGGREYVRSCCEASLKRLGINCIDLYFYHRKDPDTEIEETVSEMAALVREGKVKYLGLSEVSGATLRRAHAVHPISAVQVEFAPWTLDIRENGLLAAARELGIAIVAYSPLGRGFLSGKIRSADDFGEKDLRRFLPRFQGENFTINLALVDKFAELASAKGCSSSQLVLAWVLRQGEDFIPIPGTTKVANLEENVHAAHVSLSDEDMAQVDNIISQLEVSGERYPEAAMQHVGH